MSRRKARRAKAAAAKITSVPASGETKDSPDATNVTNAAPPAPTTTTTTTTTLLTDPASTTTDNPDINLLPLATTTHDTLEAVLAGMDETLRDYAVATIDDVEDPGMMDPPELVQALLDAVSSILISSDFCAHREAAVQICRELATVVLQNLTDAAEEADSLAWMTKSTMSVGYENLPTNSDSATRFVLMGEQKKTNVEEMGTMDDFLGKKKKNIR